MTEPEKLVLDTSAGEFPLIEYRFQGAGREWFALHTGAVLTEEDELRVIAKKEERLPYGVALWPSAIALGHEVASRDFKGLSVLELGSGTGLPGIVAASLGASVVQTDRDELAMQLCRRNGERNGQRQIEYRLADWTSWEDQQRYDCILGSDILYGESLHPQLRRIFDSNLALAGKILLSDPFRPMSITFLEAMERDGWGVVMSKWNVGEDERPVAVFELTPPALINRRIQE